MFHDEDAAPRRRVAARGPPARRSPRCGRWTWGAGRRSGSGGSASRSSPRCCEALPGAIVNVELKSARFQLPDLGLAAAVARLLRERGREERALVSLLRLPPGRRLPSRRTGDPGRPARRGRAATSAPHRARHAARRSRRHPPGPPARHPRARALVERPRASRSSSGPWTIRRRRDGWPRSARRHDHERAGPDPRGARDVSSKLPAGLERAAPRRREAEVGVLVGGGVRLAVARRAAEVRHLASERHHVRREAEAAGRAVEAGTQLRERGLGRAEIPRDW